MRVDIVDVVFFKCSVREPTGAKSAFMMPHQVSISATLRDMVET
jgi:hypothetical protein